MMGKKDMFKIFGAVGSVAAGAFVGKVVKDHTNETALSIAAGAGTTALVGGTLSYVDKALANWPRKDVNVTVNNPEEAVVVEPEEEPSERIFTDEFREVPEEEADLDEIIEDDDWPSNFDPEKELEDEVEEPVREFGEEEVVETSTDPTQDDAPTKEEPVEEKIAEPEKTKEEAPAEELTEEIVEKVVDVIVDESLKAINDRGSEVHMDPITGDPKTTPVTLFDSARLYDELIEKEEWPEIEKLNEEEKVSLLKVIERRLAEYNETRERYNEQFKKANKNRKQRIARRSAELEKKIARAEQISSLLQ